MEYILDKIRLFFRIIIRYLLNWYVVVFGPRLNPDLITLVGLFLHFYIFYTITQGELMVSGILLAVFGLFDTVDGEAARMLDKESDRGLFLDAVTDRIKEALLYSGLIVYFYSLNDVLLMLLCALALGGGLTVSYVKAKGEMVLSSKKGNKLTSKELNRIFQDGLARFEIRMGALVIGMILPLLSVAVLFNAFVSWVTVVYRMWNIYRKL